ncbi:MAG: class I SAM-dependent methyltransferase [Gammaproteobacteria bacterium]|nr:class I SAM-dependent methyltransferase [Gammaproteobacteria bacterium]
MKNIEYALKGFRAPFFKILNREKERFLCPICNYFGPFKDKNTRLHAKCPKCGELERARLQFLVLSKLFENKKLSTNKILHIAPENAFRKLFKKKFISYTSGDMFRKDVDENFDIQDIPFENETFDMVFASHVLEYPDDDLKAISEIKRILKPNGVAILPVPLVHDLTHDRKERHKITRMMHEPGLDYFKRFETIFSNVEIHKAEMYPEKHQLFIYRGDFGNGYPLSLGDGRYSDIVPVCYA